jgi:hypothetical protein
MKAKFTAKQIANQKRAKESLTAEEYAIRMADDYAALEKIDAITDEIESARRLATDAVPATLLPRMLEIVIAQAEREYEVKYPWRDIFPVDVYDWTKKTVIIPIYTSEGIAQWYNGGGKHPNVITGMKEVSVTMYDLTAAYTLEWINVQREQGAGINTETEKLSRVFQAHDAFISDVVWTGDTAHAIQPFITHTNMGSGAVPNGDWDDGTTPATAAEILADILYAARQPFVQNRGVPEMENAQVDILLPSSQYDIADDATVNSYTNESALDMVAKKKFIRTIRSVPKLDTTAGGSGDFIIVGVFTSDNIAVVLGADKLAMPRDDGGWYIEAPYLSSTGGVHLKRPLAFWRGTGLHAT